MTPANSRDRCSHVLDAGRKSEVSAIASPASVDEHDHRQPRAVARLGVFQHLPVAGRIAEGGARTAADFQVDAFRLAGSRRELAAVWLEVEKRRAVYLVEAAREEAPSLHGRYPLQRYREPSARAEVR